MPQITKPLLAGKFDPEKARFPLIATPKIDGIRFLMVNGVAVSRTFKPIRNVHIQALLSKHLPDGIDGELTCGSTFQESTSGVMTIEGEPQFKAWIFDYVSPNFGNILSFQMRLSTMPLSRDLPFDFEVLHGVHVESMEELDAFEASCLEAGYEGAMVRDPNGTYKMGRSTVKDGILLKIKRFDDAEAVVIGIEEKMSNRNEAQKDAFGRTKRSTHQENMVATGTAGALRVRNADGLEFSIGSGLNDELRAEIWANQAAFIGKIAKYKSFSIGVKELPRHPVLLGFRDPEDM
jgi:DNA ligase-1